MKARIAGAEDLASIIVAAIAFFVLLWWAIIGPIN